MSWELSIAIACAAFVVGCITGLAFAAFTASNFGRRRPTPKDRTWPKPSTPTRTDTTPTKPERHE